MYLKIYILRKIFIFFYFINLERIDIFHLHSNQKSTSTYVHFKRNLIKFGMIIEMTDSTSQIKKTVEGEYYISSHTYRNICFQCASFVCSFDGMNTSVRYIKGSLLVNLYWIQIKKYMKVYFLNLIFVNSLWDFIRFSSLHIFVHTFKYSFILRSYIRWDSNRNKIYI